jgi:hypothetical protein
MSAQATALQTLASGNSDERSPRRRPLRVRAAARPLPLGYTGRANEEGGLAGNRASADAESRYAGRIYAAVAT